MIARWLMMCTLRAGLRGGIPDAELLAAITRAFPRRTPAWRLELLEQAKAKAAARGA